MRLDQYLLLHHFVTTLKESQGHILAGKVLVNDKIADKCGITIKKNDVVRMKTIKNFASRAAQKILPFLDNYPDFKIEQKNFMDIGASTGGFTSVLLQKNARQIIAIDVGYGQLDASLQQHPQVHMLDRTHICHLQTKQLPYMPDAFLIDVSFISLRKVVPCMLQKFSHLYGLLLLKPQFELQFSNMYKEEKKDVHKFFRGVLKDSRLRQKIIDDFRDFLIIQNITVMAEENAHLTGSKGNLEYIFWIKW